MVTQHIYLLVVSSEGVVTFVALLVGVLLMIIALMVWQEARRRPSYEPLEYVINDAIKHITERISPEVKLEQGRHQEDFGMGGVLPPRAGAEEAIQPGRDRGRRSRGIGRLHRRSR